ncbi:MAG: hypothetical protein DSZ06_03545 [Sulfurospirillum sp.]|nr:MAG: hypothetical protein DSZ06_03545 [Sulfurospirillum sp.]
MIQSLSSWTLEEIRKSHCMDWMEEKRIEWVSIVASSLSDLINAKPIIVITDQKREWFGDYLIQSLNSSDFNRPLLPLFVLKSLFKHIDSLEDEQNLELLNDMLEILFPNGYRFFYIGSGEDRRAKIAKESKSSMLWMYDKKDDGAFYMGIDESVSDTKLIQLLELFDKSIDAVLFGEVDILGSL